NTWRPRSITVLKVNDDTGEVLAGWTMNLYQGGGCTGPIYDTKVTNSHGIADFTGLEVGNYSVGEVNQSGWTPMSGTCQSMTVSRPANAAPPTDSYGAGSTHTL